MLPAPGTNQIAGFSGHRPLTIKEINKKVNSYLRVVCLYIAVKCLNVCVIAYG